MASFNDIRVPKHFGKGEPKVTYWYRSGFQYVSKREIFEYGAHYSVVRKLDFFSYHLIKFIHGNEKLKAMAEADPRKVWL